MSKENINFNEQYKIRISNPDNSMRKHDIVKQLIVAEIMLRTKNEKKYHCIYTEYPVCGKRVDVYHKNLKTNEIIVYEVQLKITKEWEEELKEKVLPEVDYIIVGLNLLSNNILKLNKQIKELVVV